MSSSTRGPDPTPPALSLTPWQYLQPPIQVGLLGSGVGMALLLRGGSVEGRGDCVECGGSVAECGGCLGAALLLCFGNVDWHGCYVGVTWVQCEAGVKRRRGWRGPGALHCGGIASAWSCAGAARGLRGCCVEAVWGLGGGCVERRTLIPWSKSSSSPHILSLVRPSLSVVRCDRVG